MQGKEISGQLVLWVAAMRALPYFLGIAAIGWGARELRVGKALVYNYTALRTERPFTFLTVILVFRFLIGAALLGAVARRIATA